MNLCAGILISRRAAAGMTLVEVVVAMGVFAIGSLGVIESQALFNNIAARERCDAAAQSFLRAKIAKVLTDPWDIAAPAFTVVNGGFTPDAADSNDPYDAGGSAVVLLAASGTPASPIVMGSLQRYTRALDGAATPTVLVDYKLTYVFRSTTYTLTAGTVRARDR